MVINSPACRPEPNGYIWSISLNLVPIQCPILLAFLMWKNKSKCCRVLEILKEKKELGPVEQMDKYRIKSFFFLNTMDIKRNQGIHKDLSQKKNK